MIARDSVYSAVKLVFSSAVCLILCLFQTSSFHIWLSFNGAIFLRWFFDTLLGCVSWLCKEESIKNKIPPQPSAHGMHTSCHHLISVHSSKATPPSSNHYSKITSHHPPVEAWFQCVKGEMIKVKSSLIEWTTPEQLLLLQTHWLSSEKHIWTSGFININIDSVALCYVCSRDLNVFLSLVACIIKKLLLISQMQ